MKRIFLSILGLLIIFTSSYSNSNSYYISEINFIDEEYIEIISNNSSNQNINFSNFYIYDDLGSQKNNSISLHFQNNSSWSIIAGSNFYQKHTNLSPFCNYYITSGSQLSNGGLKSFGEDILLLNPQNNTLNFSWKKENDLNFETNQSLHFYNQSSFISKQSICSKSKLQVNYSNIVNQNNQTNTSNTSNRSNNTQLNSSCNEEFSIKIKDRNMTSKLEFDFISSINQNFSIEYWVENYEEKILKNKIITRNFNTKSYTPSKTNPIIIKANLYHNNCSYSNKSESFFYKYEELLEEEIEDNSQENKEKQSYLDLFTREIIKENIMKLSLELYRGDTLKRVLHIYNNGKKTSSIEIPTKYTKIKTTLLIPLEIGDNKIVLDGIDLSKELIHFIEDIQEDDIISSIPNLTLPKITFFNISKKQNTISRPFFSSGKIQISCTIYQSRTKVSNTFEIELGEGFHIAENTIIENKINIMGEKKENNVELKQTCKYKLENKKSFIYENIYFNYSLNSNLNQNKTLKYKSNLTQIQTNLNKTQENLLQIKSSNTKLKEKVNMPILGAMSILVIGMVLMW